MRTSITLLVLSGVAMLFILSARGSHLDILTYGSQSSETAHALNAIGSEVVVGDLGQSVRKLLPAEPASWAGGTVSFVMKVDPDAQNYFTAKFSGSEITVNRLVLYCDDKQIGYLHLGDIPLLDTGTDAPAYNGRFYYTTTPLPMAMTGGKSQLKLEIRSHGRIWGYGAAFDQYQRAMTEPSRGIYRAYTHTDGFFTPPADERQGPAPKNPPLRKAPGAEVMDELKARVNRELSGILKKPAPNQMEMQFLANAHYVKWTVAYQNHLVVERVIAGADKLYADFKQDNRVAEAGPATYNPEWFGAGPVGDSVRLLIDQIAPKLDEKITGDVTRRAGWSQMLCHSREWHRRHRRLYTNQSMINDLYGIYLSNRGVAAIDAQNAAPEEQMRRYLYESVGLQPWLGSETDNGPEKPVGENYMQLTRAGLTKELGYVGNYGEVLDWVTTIYNATRPAPGHAGDESIRAQLVKMARARAVFRYPALDAEGNRAMRLETIIGWRDTHYPGDVTYQQRTAWDGSSIQSAAATLDPHLLGYAQQMLDDNQYFESVRTRMKTNGLRVTAGMLDTPDEYDTIKAQSPSAHRLPMTTGAGDFVFTDEEDGVIALKHGDDILYASLYWRARFGINNLARVHHMTPQIDRIATIAQQTEYEPSGMNYTRPNHIDFGFGNGGHKYPGDLQSAHAGEVLPIAKIPAGVKFRPGDENVHAGKGSFYVCRYGPYLMAMNCTDGKTFELAKPADVKQGEALDLVSGEMMALGKPILVGPMKTLVLRINP